MNINIYKNNLQNPISLLIYNVINGIAAPLLYLYHDVLSSPTCSIFNKSLAEGVFLSVLKCNLVTPILKAGNPADITNYRPIFVLPLLSKIFELIVLKRIERSLLSTISQTQHGFFPDHSIVSRSVDSCSFVHTCTSLLI
jgi:hypothetical protein|uniref:RNA-directed DNA polymerase n=1 Tax=Sipha flava TaxID=143950 RepID=A0A2S2R0K8_9HEMI